MGVAQRFPSILEIKEGLKEKNPLKDLVTRKNKNINKNSVKKPIFLAATFLLLTSIICSAHSYVNLNNDSGSDPSVTISEGGIEPINQLADAWLGIDSTNLDSHCGSDPGQSLADALDGIDYWVHSVDEEHWFILDLGQTYTIKQVRGRSDFFNDPTNVDIYVSTSKSSWGTAVSSDISSWQDTSTWSTVDVTDKNGRYIKVVIQATEDSFWNFIDFGDAPPNSFTIFDAYGDVFSGNNPPLQSGECPTNQSTNISLTPSLYVNCSDSDSADTMNATWWSNSSGSWAQFGSNLSIVSGTNITQTNSNFSSYSTKYWWSVNLSDGHNWTNATYHFTTTPLDHWIGIDSSNLDSSCGSDPGYALSDALDGTDLWVHQINEEHWFIIDLGESYTIKQVRGRSSEVYDPIDIDIYVSTINGSWGTAVASDISTWQDTTSWQTVDTTDKVGRYIKVVIQDTEDPTNFLSFGDLGPSITMFDAYGNNVSANNAPTQSGESPTNQSTNIGLTPSLNVICSDTDSATMNATWRSNSSGSWATFATNNSISSGTNITQTNTNFSSYSTKYYWSVNLSDGTSWTNKTYHFTTESIDTAINSISPYMQPSSSVSLSVSGYTDLDSVTLWYRYSTDNTTWSTSDWWNENWNCFKTITIDHTKISDNLNNFPVLVTINSTIAAKCDEGDSIRFVGTDNTTEYFYQIEEWNSSGISYVWVNITTVSSSTDTTVLLYYNNSDAVDNQNPSNVWNSDYKMVYHFNETVEGGSYEDHYDSTVNNNDAETSSGMNMNTDGKIDGTDYWDGTDYVYIPHDSSNQISGDMTVEAWIKWEGTSDPWAYILEKGNSDNDNYGFFIVDANDSIGFEFEDTSDTWRSFDESSGATITQNTWEHVVVVYDDTNDKIYFYNAGKETDNQSTTYSIQGDQTDQVWIGRQNYAGNDFYFTGYIDEVRISDCARNASWINASFSNTDSPSTFLSFGSEKKYGWQQWNDATNPDTSSPWSWTFDFPNGTGYYEFYSIGEKSGTSDEQPPGDADAICRKTIGNPPTLSGEVPANGATDIDLNPSLYVLCQDADGNTMNATWRSNSSGSWITFATNNSIVNNTNITQVNANFSSGNTKYYWSVNLSDGHVWTNETYYFTIKNNPPTHSTPVLNSSAGTNTPSENLTCYPQSTSDLDGDTVKNIFNWYKNSTSLTLLNMAFEGGSNATWTRDYSSYQNNGSVINASWNSTGGYDDNGSYWFDGNGDRVVVSDVNYENNFSIVFWFKGHVTTGKTFSYLYSHGTVSTQNSVNIYFYAAGDGGLTTDVLDSNDLDGGHISIDGLNDSKWHHYALTVGQGSGVKVYIDGSLNSSNASMGGDSIDPATDLYLGCRTDLHVDRFMTGTIDELLIVNHTLSAEQITAFYNNRTNRIVSQETSLNDIWSCEVTPNDGTVDGTTKMSNSLTISESTNTVTINSLNFDNSTGSKFNNQTGSITVGNTYTFSVNITEENGWASIDYINLTCWYDNGDDTSTYNQTLGGNINMFLQYENTTGTVVFRMRWPDDEATLDEINCTETIIDSTTRIINFSFIPGNQMRYASSNDTWDTTSNVYNDVYSWNLNCTVTNNDNDKRYMINEYGMNWYSTVTSPTLVEILGAPGTSATSNTFTVTYIINSDYKLLIYCEDNLTHVSTDDVIEISGNLTVLETADENDDLTVNTTYSGINQNNAVTLYNTSAPLNNQSCSVSVQFELSIPFGTYGKYTSIVAKKINKME